MKALIPKSELVKKILEDRQYRTITFAICSLIFNIWYATYNGVLGFMSNSYWFKAMWAYHIILGVMRFSVVLSNRKNNLKREYKIMKFTGLLLIILSWVLSGIVYMSLSQNKATKYGEIIMITIATYTFYKITMAIIRTVKYHKINTPTISAIHFISYAEIAVSVLTMQMSMLVSFEKVSNNDIFIFNLLTGIGVCLFTLALGIIMIRKGVCKNGKIKDSKSK